MNPFLVELGREKISSEPDLCSSKFVIEDNVGESIHIHYRNMRLELTIKEFMELSKGLKDSLETLEKWE